jgi:hypothetical protein
MYSRNEDNLKNLKFLQLISKFILINILCLVLFASNAQSAKLEDRVSCLISAAQYFEGLDLNYCKKSNGCKDLKGNEFYFVRGSENELGIIVQNLGTRVVYTKNGFAVIESFRDCTELTLNPKNASDKSATSDQKTKFNLIFDKVKFKNCKTSEVKRHTLHQF